jgi:hypothetical protein
LPNPNSYDPLIEENRDLVEMATERMYKMEWGDRYLNTTPEQQAKLRQWLYNKKLWHSIAWHTPSLTEQVKEGIEWITSPIVWKMTKQELFNTLVALQLLAEKTTEWMPTIPIPKWLKGKNISWSALQHLPETILVYFYPQLHWTWENTFKASKIVNASKIIEALRKKINESSYNIPLKFPLKTWDKLPRNNK